MNFSMSKRPSPALIVAAIAMSFALVGTSVAADPVAKLNKAKVKKIANKQISKAAPTLSVRNALEAENAKTATKATTADTAATATSVAANGVNTAALQNNAVTGEKVNEATLNLGLTRVLGVESAFNSVTPKSSTATCPAGSKVVGTGYVNDGGANGGNPDLKEILTDEVVPSANLISVSVDTYETDSTATNWSTQAIAICAAVAG